MTTKKCEYLNQPALCMVRCVAKMAQCPKRYNKGIVAQRCWQVEQRGES